MFSENIYLTCQELDEKIIIKELTVNSPVKTQLSYLSYCHYWALREKCFTLLCIFTHNTRMPEIHLHMYKQDPYTGINGELSKQGGCPWTGTQQANWHQLQSLRIDLLPPHQIYEGLISSSTG